VSAHAARKNLNTALLKNYHLHDHCLLSKWKRATCAQTTSLQHVNAVLKNDQYAFDRNVVHCLKVWIYIILH